VRVFPEPPRTRLSLHSLLGVALLQAWFYFQWYSKDSWVTKSLVSPAEPPAARTLTLVDRFSSYGTQTPLHCEKNVLTPQSVLETFQIAVFTRLLYYHLIENFGDVPGLLIIVWYASPLIPL
jgi:hypothetical protein